MGFDLLTNKGDLYPLMSGLRRVWQEKNASRQLLAWSRGLTSCSFVLGTGVVFLLYSIRKIA